MTPAPAPLWFRADVGHARLGFTDARTDLGRGPAADGSAVAGVQSLGAALGGRPALMRQVHGAQVAVADPDAPTPQADALIVDRPGIVAIVRVADCTPVVVVAPDRPLAAVVHAGRVGMAAGIVTATVDQLRRRGAEQLEAWVGPRACGRCYEVPAQMADDVAALEPAARATTRRGTPGLDIGAGVIAQLQRAGVTVHDLGGCTIEDDTFWSHRRQGDAAGRFGAGVVLGEAGDHAAP
ncbi:laccase [Aeromicrobium sp. 636]|uniref:Polyphenol oxidase family protein n=1 Tax=Aeromicrobium senzhongii TaxID=2663859 RepID=A0A8I0ETV2_9ACTN|nr:polyphenol oxidase family protein [Aeromicrobium sp. 636]MBC9225439.1 polyphenol oxidase family protein [Aeromicrobium senzhongii]MCQ3997549.1 laccase [Aeromicrobium sp. 636]